MMECRSLQTQRIHHLGMRLPAWLGFRFYLDVSLALFYRIAGNFSQGKILRYWYALVLHKYFATLNFVDVLKRPC